MTMGVSAPRSQIGILVVGLALTAAFVSWALVLMSTTSYDTWGALLAAPVLVAVTLPMLSRQARREGDARLLRFLVLALLLKLGAALFRHYVAFEVYGGVADATGYHNWGIRIAENFSQGLFTTGLRSLTETDFIRLLTGVLYTVTRPSLIIGFLFYSWLGFLGLFWMYRAFVIAVPEGRSRTYARLIFLYPSLLFWPSSVGKEAWMIFALGIGALGVSKVLTGQTAAGVLIVAFGLGLMWLVRPHIAAMIGASLAVAFLLRPMKEEWGELAPLARLIGVVAVGILAVWVMLQAQEFLNEQVTTPSGFVSALESVSTRADQGGSQFTPVIVRSPLQVPKAVVTTFFRPVFLEAHNAQTIAAAAEGMLLLGLMVVRVRWIFAAVRSVRRQPYVAFAIAYVGLFAVAFASIPNFGLLARQRVQMLPFLFVLLSIPPADLRDHHVTTAPSGERVDVG